MIRLALLTVLVSLFAACGPVYERPAVTGSLAMAEPQVMRGERVFYQHCHSCHPHGGRGLGKGVTDRPLPAFAVRLQIRNGFGEMPAFSQEEIDASDLDALIAFLSELRIVWAGEDR